MHRSATLILLSLVEMRPQLRLKHLGNLVKVSQLVSELVVTDRIRSQKALPYKEAGLDLVHVWSSVWLLI